MVGGVCGRSGRRGGEIEKDEEGKGGGGGIGYEAGGERGGAAAADSACRSLIQSLGQSLDCGSGREEAMRGSAERACVCEGGRGEGRGAQL